MNKSNNRPHLSFLTLTLKKMKQIMLSVLLMAILGDVLFLPTSSDVIIFGLLAVYIGYIIFYKLESKLTFLISLGILLTIYLAFILTGTSVKTEKAAVWLFFFVLIGIVQQLRK